MREASAALSWADRAELPEDFAKLNEEIKYCHVRCRCLSFTVPQLSVHSFMRMLTLSAHNELLNSNYHQKCKNVVEFLLIS